MLFYEKYRADFCFCQVLSDLHAIYFVQLWLLLSYIRFILIQISVAIIQLVNMEFIYSINPAQHVSQL